MGELRLDGGLDDGATLVDGGGRVAGSWSGSVARRMAHLRERGFDGARLPLGIDELGVRLSPIFSWRLSEVGAPGRDGLTVTKRWCTLRGGCAGSMRRS
jgi:hypothetical protein